MEEHSIGQENMNDTVIQSLPINNNKRNNDNNNNSGNHDNYTPKAASTDHTLTFNFNYLQKKQAL